jgi:hypothetical protein
MYQVVIFVGTSERHTGRMPAQSGDLASRGDSIGQFATFRS